MAEEREPDRSTVASSYDSIPAALTAAWVKQLGSDLERATWKGQAALKQMLPARIASQILARAAVHAKSEPTLVEVNPSEEGATVTVVGDTHGQIHDLLNMFETAGFPSETNYYVFNGDFVDRGAWGLEVLLVLGAWKSAYPKQVTLLRGNHETTTCTMMYGFKGELDQKFGRDEVRPVYAICKRLFAALPLAACIGGTTLVLHGGLFRKHKQTVTAKNKSKRKQHVPAALSGQCELGSMADLRTAAKGGPDPNGRGSSGLATDVLWSDPVSTPGIELNVCRGVGTIFGPDITQRFLQENGLRLVLRSHEGPDARYDRSDMPNMQQGWTTDHAVEAGQLLTVFSAPDYPQFQADESQRYGNLAAVAKLRGPDWCKPEMIQFAAVLPRPHAVACYDYVDIPGSDEEFEFAASEASGASSLGSDAKDTATQSAAAVLNESPSASTRQAKALDVASCIGPGPYHEEEAQDTSSHQNGLHLGSTANSGNSQSADVPSLTTSVDNKEAVRNSPPLPTALSAALPLPAALQEASPTPTYAELGEDLPSACNARPPPPAG